MTSADHVYLQSGSETLFFLIHGYTGSTSDFNGLPGFLRENYDMDIIIPLLPGHGTRIEDLEGLRFRDFFTFVEKVFVEEQKNYQRIFIGGISFGAQLALVLASRYDVQGVFHACIPYQLKFPFSLPGIQLLGSVKKYWRKKIPEQERKLRASSFYYSHMPAFALSIVREANRVLDSYISNISCPLLALHSFYDPIGSVRGLDFLERQMNTIFERVIFSDSNHNIFFSESRHTAYKRIGDFFEKYR